MIMSSLVNRLSGFGGTDRRLGTDKDESPKIWIYFVSKPNETVGGIAVCNEIPLPCLRRRCPGTVINVVNILQRFL